MDRERVAERGAKRAYRASRLKKLRFGAALPRGDARENYNELAVRVARFVSLFALRSRVERLRENFKRNMR